MGRRLRHDFLLPNATHDGNVLLLQGLQQEG
jgi:hypothetical protein